MYVLSVLFSLNVQTCFSFVFFYQHQFAKFWKENVIFLQYKVPSYKFIMMAYEVFIWRLFLCNDVWTLKGNSLQVTLFHFEDEPRPGVVEVISTLKDKARLRIMMLTGDHELSAMRIAKIVGIDEVYCCLKPEEKLNRVKTTSRDRGNYNFGCVYFATSV